MGAQVIELQLPYPPSVNHYYRHVGSRVLISREGREYRDRVCSAVAALGVSPLDGPLEFQAEVYPPDNRRRDLDNVLKSMFDALQHGGAYKDDSQILRIVAHKREAHADEPGGCVIVRISKL